MINTDDGAYALQYNTDTTVMNVLPSHQLSDL